MSTNPFFLNKGPYSLKYIFDRCDLKAKSNIEKKIIDDIKILNESSTKDITFFHSIKYKDYAQNAKANICITTDKLKKYLPNKCEKIVVDNVLLVVAKITKLFYPSAVTDDVNINLKTAKEVFVKKNNIILGKNVLIGKKVFIGTKTSIGHNTIVDDNVKIGVNCSIGSNVILRNTIIKNNVHILDGCSIGKKGFGFIPNNIKNFRYPHIGYVFIDDNCEIGANCTIDRGSLSSTAIGKNTFFDNQVHLAHNVKIGNNCIIAGQVGIAGSSTIGNNVMIGGQAGISGHLKIGNNVQIGGGSGVLKNIPDNCKVMGYPAKDVKTFVKEMR